MLRPERTLRNPSDDTEGDSNRSVQPSSSFLLRLVCLPCAEKATTTETCGPTHPRGRHRGQVSNRDDALEYRRCRSRSRSSRSSPLACCSGRLWQGDPPEPGPSREPPSCSSPSRALPSHMAARCERQSPSRMGKPMRGGVLHYYLGAKYFAELEYASFYACVLAADLDGRRVWDARIKVRDLSTYVIVGRDDVAPCPRDRFSPPRWSAFVRDVTALQGILPEGERAAVLTDKGFNPPPSWSVLAGWVANHVPLDHARAAKAVFNLDLAFVLIALIALAVAIDIETASVAAIFVFLYFGSVGRLAGNFLQYAWFPALTGAVLAWRRGRYRQSAFWWALATLAQTFPLALTSAIGLRYLWLWKDRKRGDAVG